MTYSFISNSGVEHFLEVEIAADDPNNNEDAHLASTIQVHLNLIIHSLEVDQIFDEEDSITYLSRLLDYSRFSYEDPSFCPNLSSILSSYGFGNDERVLDWYAEKIITVGRELIDRECENTNARVVPLMIKIWKLENVIGEEERAVRESMDEFERRNYGRVAASEAAVKGLKKVVVGLEEMEMNCGVCLEGVGIGKIGMVMPCEHGFHEDCIVKWLKESHVCPLCRYQLPTHDDESK